MAKKQRERVSHIEFVSAGLLSDVDVTFNKCYFKRWSYPNSDLEVTVFCVECTTEDGEEHELVWSVGGEDDFMPSDDGMFLEKNSDRGSLAKNSNFQKLVDSLMSNGLEGDHLDKFGESSDYLEGTNAHILRVPTKRSGMKDTGRRKRDDSGREREDEVTVVTAINSFPWDKKGSKKTATSSKASAGSNSSKSSKGDEEGDADLSGFVKKLIVKNGGEMDWDDFIMEAYQGLPMTDKAERKSAMNQLNDKKWVAALDGIELDGDKISVE